MPGLPSNVAPPPHFALRLASDDPDEVTSWVAPRDGQHSRVVHGTGPYGFRVARIDTPVVQFTWASTRLGNTLRGSFRQPTLHVPLRGLQSYSFGRRRIEVAMGGLVFMAPGTEAARHTEGHPLLAIELDAGVFEAEVLRRHESGRNVWSCVPQALDLSEPHKLALIEAINGLVNAHATGPAAPSPTHDESRLLSMLAGALTGSVTGRARPVSVRRLKYLENWIDAHVGEAITLGMLCEVVQVGVRSLQIAFQARRGMSPMRFVAERRLTAAQRRFSKASEGDDVTAIATSLGFTHLGRFSSAYRSAFGESPSRTLMRGRQWARTHSDAASPGIGGGE